MLHLLVSMCLMFFLFGCQDNPVKVATLDCIVKRVMYTESDRETVFKKEDAIRNGFIYHFDVYDNDILIVNQADRYIKDANSTVSYSLERETTIDTNMKFVFTKAFDNVRFLFLEKEIIYTYTCTKQIL